MIVLIEAGPETAIDRIAYRQTCGQCKRVYNLKFSPPKTSEECDDCHVKLAKRKDDHVEGTKKRVYQFREVMKDALEFYSKAGRLKVIDGNGDVNACVERYLTFHRSQAT